MVRRYAGAARTAEVPDPDGGSSRRFGDGADGLVQDRRVLRGGDKLSADVVGNGGFAGIACPWKPGVTTCHR
ncbi:hypothetical protein ACIHCX_37965 [Streptomyces sp. NPDC052043]|uniref:hypothetical protein n=1 Tax=Streptomyces sp. NPDC052043 TaxID=3365684 RepID=UPI0037D83D72